MTEERRRWPARPKSINLVYFGIFSASGNNMMQQGMGRTLNISSGGILLETYDKILENEKIFLSLGLKDDMIEIEAEIAHSSKNKENGKYLTGFSFVVDNDCVKEKIQEHIKLFNESEK